MNTRYEVVSPLAIARRIWQVQAISERVSTLGDLQTQEQIAKAGTMVANVGGAAATAMAANGVWLSAAAIPFIGVGVAAVTAGLMLFFGRKGPQQKVASTNIVNELEPRLKANLDAYMAGPRTPESQAQAVQNFDDVWGYLKSSSACGSPDLGNPGKACIADRDRGGQWDWFSYYRDPIAYDPMPAQLAAQSSASMVPAAIAPAADSLMSSVRSYPWLWMAGATIAVLALTAKKREEHF